MRRFFTMSVAIVLGAGIAAAGCSSSSSSTSGASTSKTTSASMKPVTPATDAQRAALFDRVKQLNGAWQMKDETGKLTTTAVFTVSSAGSAVREVMFPGAGEEMTNMYHMDGPALVMVHYCAEGNQPHLRATTDNVKGNQIVLKSDSVANLTSADGGYMGKLTITFKDADHIQQEWQSYKAGKEAEKVVFELERKKG